MSNFIYRGPGGALNQAAALRREGVTVGTGHLGELTVDFSSYGWFPDHLPSAESDSTDEETEQDKGQ